MGDFDTVVSTVSGLSCALLASIRELMREIQERAVDNLVQTPKKAKDERSNNECYYCQKNRPYVSRPPSKKGKNGLFAFRYANINRSKSRLEESGRS